MGNFEDKFAKWVLRAVLREFGMVITEQEIVETRQRMDIWFEAQHSEGLSEAGLPGRMAVESIMIEVFSRPPGQREFFQCLRKRLNWEHERKKDGKATSGGLWAPRLWIISKGRPKTVLRKKKFKPMPAWPQGVFESGEIRLIVLGELPLSPDTLSLRLLDSRDRRMEAIRSIEALPPGAFEKRTIYPMLCSVYGKDMTQPKTSLTEKDLEIDPLDLLSEVREEALADGRLEGRLEGERSLILKQCEYKFGKIPKRRRTQIESAPPAQLNTWATRLLTATSLDAVFDDAVQG